MLRSGRMSSSGEGYLKRMLFYPSCFYGRSSGRTLEQVCMVVDKGAHQATAFDLKVVAFVILQSLVMKPLVEVIDSALQRLNVDGEGGHYQPPQITFFKRAKRLVRETTEVKRQKPPPSSHRGAAACA
jgi:hypothetical protein